MRSSRRPLQRSAASISASVLVPVGQGPRVTSTTRSGTNFAQASTHPRSRGLSLTSIRSISLTPNSRTNATITTTTTETVHVSTTARDSADAGNVGPSSHSPDLSNSYLLLVDEPSQDVSVGRFPESLQSVLQGFTEGHASAPTSQQVDCDEADGIEGDELEEDEHRVNVRTPAPEPGASGTSVTMTLTRTVSSASSLILDSQVLEMDVDDFMNWDHIDSQSGPIAPHAEIDLSEEAFARRTPFSSESPTVLEQPLGFPDLTTAAVHASGSASPHAHVDPINLHRVSPAPAPVRTSPIIPEPPLRQMTDADKAALLDLVSELHPASELPAAHSSPRSPSRAPSSAPSSSRPIAPIPKRTGKTRGTIPLDAPIQHRTYHGPSVTARKAVPKAAEQHLPEENRQAVVRFLEDGDAALPPSKRARTSTSAVDPEIVQQAQGVSEKILRKRRNNTLSARKSRQRKEDELQQLREEATLRREEADAQRARADRLERQLAEALARIQALEEAMEED